MGINISVSGTDRWDPPIHALGDTDSNIPNDTAKAIQDAAEVVADEARSLVLAEPVHTAHFTGLREKIAAGTKVDHNSDGATIHVDPAGEFDNAPSDMDAGGWSHPVFGNRRNWVYQGGYEHWWTDAVDPSDPMFEAAVEAVVDVEIDKVAAA